MASAPDTPVASFVGVKPDVEDVRRVLLVRLRSIGDTVLMTPCITALKRWRPDVEVDVLLEPFCAPVLEAHPDVSSVVVADRRFAARARAAARLRRRRYDLAINLSGGSTGALLAFASGARVRVGFSGYRQPWLANSRVTSSHDVWRRTDVHTVEHQLALVAGIGIPTGPAGPTSLATTADARAAVGRRLEATGVAPHRYVVVHPEASLPDKRWPAERFAHLVESLERESGLRGVVVGIDRELVARAAGARGVALPDLSLAETMALVERATLFVGNDSGPAHFAAAFGRPTVVVFGSSNVELWRPWSSAPWRVVRGRVAADVSFGDVRSAVDEVVAAVPVG